MKTIDYHRYDYNTNQEWARVLGRLGRLADWFALP